MWLLIAEALIALGMLVFIVWWTMSSRRKEATEPSGDPELLARPAQTASPADAPAPPAPPVKPS